MLANGRDLPEHMLANVASLLGVTVDELRGDTENEKKPLAQGEGRRERLSKLSYEDLLLLQEDVIAELRERGQK
nr:MAG TPA: hypothetical protein [Caudoviricetes sp.]